MSKSNQGASPSFHYFYTDPLAAAWMSKHFRMRFRIKSAEEGTFQEAYIEAYANHIHWSPVGWMGCDQRFYIHPDSLYLLEPRLGDIGEPVLDSVFGHFDAVRLSTAHELAETISPLPKFSRIIQRNGVAFMWPEREAV